ncbi:MAG TPA: hypothetical protein VE991_11660, partial [Acidimicrobiales bacterium]|nr:hypothetical protein [Acidimicrobiales bacterium]
MSDRHGRASSSRDEKLPTRISRVASGFGALLLVAAGVLTFAPAAFAGSVTTFNQCADGTTVPIPTTACSATDASSWQNGDLQKTNSVYKEGDSVPFRLQLGGLSLGSHTLVINWDSTRGGIHAYDYLTSYPRTVTGADPCAGGLSDCTFP